MVKAKWQDIEPIAANMRDADELEGWLSSHKTPLEAITVGFNSSIKVWTIMSNGTPIGMFGVSSPSILANIGTPWLLGTDEMLNIRRQFVRESMHYLDEMFVLYPRLVNFIHVDNVASLRWLRWMAFDFDGPIKFGAEDAEFFRFEKVSHV